MADFRLHLQGVDEALRNLGAVAEDKRHRLAGALYEEAEAIMAVAKERAPVDEGIMRASGFVELPQTTSDEISVTLGFGGPSEAYVVRQHEDLTLAHDDGEAKFLEKPALEAASGLAERIRERIA